MSQLSKFAFAGGPGSGTVTSISAGTGITLTPNPITTTGTVALTTPVSIATQPSFLASLSANTATNVTGDGTVYTVICNTVRYDQGGNYNNATGTFTAPVTGRYLLVFNVTAFGMNATHVSYIPQIKTSSINYDTYVVGYIAAGTNVFGQFSFPGSVVANMTAGDTATFTMYINGGTKTVGIGGTAAFTTDRPTFVSATLLV